MNPTKFTLPQQQRYDEMLKDFWSEPVLARNRNNPETIAESVTIATAAARTNDMSDDEFKSVIDELVGRGQEEGDLGGEFYNRVVSKLKELRSLPL